MKKETVQITVFTSLRMKFCGKILRSESLTVFCFFHTNELSKVGLKLKWSKCGVEIVFAFSKS